jgi:hypothetical protein
LYRLPAPVVTKNDVRSIIDTGTKSRSTSYGSLLKVCGCVVVWVLSSWISSCPSGAACRKAATAMKPLPPGLLSITTGCPHRAASASASTRSAASGPLPGGKGVTTRTGREGNCCAQARVMQTGAHAAAAHAPMALIKLRLAFMGAPFK